MTHRGAAVVTLLPHCRYRVAMLAFHYDAHHLPLPPGHRFPQDKYRLLREALEAVPEGLRIRNAPAVAVEDLVLVHDVGYVQRVLEGGLSPAEQREIGFPWSETLVSRSCHSVGATVAASRAAWLEGISVNLAGGNHHAHAHKGSGYCVFNDVAVAARLMQAARRRQGDESLQVLVIDLDVHQGDGTAALFQGDDSVFTLSLHGEKNFPFRKQASDLDVPLPDGCGDAVYLAALDEALTSVERVLAERPPGFAFYLAGADPHEGDRLGRLGLSSAAMLDRDEMVLQWLELHGVPTVMCMAGGYGKDLPAMLQVQVDSVRAAQRSWQRRGAREWIR